MRRTVEDAEKTRVAILNAAAKVFARDGFDAASLETVGREAGVTRGAIYWHFKDKQDLFEKIIGREDLRLERLIETAHSGQASPLTTLRRLMAAVVDNFYENEIFRQQIVLTWYRLNTSQFAPVMKAKSVFVQDFLALMEGLLAEAQAGGELDSQVDTHQAAFNLSCLINGFYRLYHVAPDWAHDKAAAHRLFEAYLNSLQALSATFP